MIVHARPPNFEQVLAAFPGASGAGVIFAYGGNVYNPSGVVIPAPLMAHETVHLDRQMEDPDWWWSRYLEDAEFRYHEELLAHVAEFKAQAHSSDRNYRDRLLRHTAARLVAPLYNYSPPRSLQQAVRDLRKELQR